MRNVPQVVLFDELLLSRRTLPIKVDYDEVNPTLVLLVQTNGAASLPLGIKSALAEHENVIRLTPDGAVFEVLAGDKRAVLAVARKIKPRIQPQVFGGAQIGRHTQRGSHQHQTDDSLHMPPKFLRTVSLIETAASSNAGVTFSAPVFPSKAFRNAGASPAASWTISL